MPSLAEIIGPRVPPEELERHFGRYLVPSGLLAAAKVLLLVSIFLPYWEMELRAPQYPDGLHVSVHLTHVSGDVREVDELNHYIGMRPLGEAAQLERSLAVYAVIALALLIEGAMFVHTPWALVFALPAIVFPLGVIADIAYWLHDFGTNLDPKAPLANAIKPFVPPIWGEGVVGQFKTIASFGSGFWLAIAASVLILTGLWFHRRAYKPLYEAYRRRREARVAGAVGSERAASGAA